jgi:hypothetical protein
MCCWISGGQLRGLLCDVCRWKIDQEEIAHKARMLLIGCLPVEKDVAGVIGEVYCAVVGGELDTEARWWAMDDSSSSSSGSDPPCVM